MKRRFLTALTAGSIALAVFAAPAAAARPTSLYWFHDCTGGSLTEFYAVKTALPEAAGYPVAAAGAFHLTDGNLIYTVYDFGNDFPPGVDQSNSDDVWCWVTFAGVPTLVKGSLSQRA